MTTFWAKTTPDGEPGISVFEHMQHVGYVASHLAELSAIILERSNLTPSEVGALAGLHDLGKISPGFQRKCKKWLEDNGLSTMSRNGCWDTSMESDHGKVSHTVIQVFLNEIGFDRKSATYLATVLGGHHGRLNRPVERGYKTQKPISETTSSINWDSERMDAAKMIWKDFNASIPHHSITDENPFLWWLAGLTTVADWIGSNEQFFSPYEHTENTDISAIAKEALKKIGFHKVEIIKELSFHDLFHNSDQPEIKWKPNEMQEKTLSVVRGSGVYVIEAPMGMGKTEAALWAAYKLLEKGKATGIYFALPTQATSNRIHLRMNEFLQRMTPTVQSSHLIHGNSWLMESTPPLSISPTNPSTSQANDARLGLNWFSSAKRALIAPFGVGTVDQALLGVVAAKHFFVRHFALAGKVVILDEVHSYDLYTGTLIDKLIATLENLGCTVIILSATLTGKRRGEIVSLPDHIEEETVFSYPLISGKYEGVSLQPVAASPPLSREVKIEFTTVDEATDDAVNLARSGGAVLWICNTVNSAQRQFEKLKGRALGDFPLGLLHSRFPFPRRDELESEWMERFGKTGNTRCGSILVSTQVVEQSVDLDADLLVTELAPTDMLLQRLGRLWRHERKGRPAAEPRLCIIKEPRSIDELREMTPKEIVNSLGDKAYVYDPFILLRTLQLWEKYPFVSIPDQIRELLEETYNDRDDTPAAWEELFDERFVRDTNHRFMAAMNSKYWQPELPDTEGVQTRLNETPTISLVLCQKINARQATFIDGSIGIFDKDIFRLETAQAIHKNLVKIPEYCFEAITACTAFADYLFGNQSLGIVLDNGTINVDGLDRKYRLTYSEELGLVIEKTTCKEKT
ncbi:MAG: CRISPR-associated helicase Cas3' [Desulfobulbaceae bacterium]|nr:CRISPR-associated helicase Cas3' [Desulfobulbaceae bacterium]